MSFPVKIYLPFRLKLLLAFLAFAVAGIYLSYSGFRTAAGTFTEEETGGRFLARLDVAAAVINAEVSTGLERARLLAARPAMREILARSAAAGGPADRKELSRLLAGEAGAAGGLTGLDLADAKGRVAATMEQDGRGADLSRRIDFRLGIKEPYVSAPRGSDNSFFYDITVPVLAAAGKGRPLGILRCRYMALPAQLAALEALRAGGTDLMLAKRGGQKLLLAEGNAPAREVNLKAPEAAPFLPALEGKEGSSVSGGTGTDKSIYASRVLNGPDWILALKTPYSAAEQRTAGLLAGARLNALLAFTLLAAASFFVVGSLTGPLRGIAREAAALLAECGMPAVAGDRLCEPEVLTAAIAEAASAMKQQASRDLDLETEAEKLREEEADLKTQNDELEKLNKYLMEREIKISELKKEISELREKVGSAAE